MDKGIFGFKEKAGLLADMPSVVPYHFSTRPYPQLPPLIREETKLND